MSDQLFLKKIILNQTPLIDVRAPIEFDLGSIPNAVNMPILNNEERHEIGTIYKEKGQESAIKRGHELVSGEVKNSRLQQWLSFIVKNNDALIYCFRGGLRSRTAQQWIKESGSSIEIIPGGYKAMRRFLLQTIEDQSNQKMIVLSGTTGSGKTEFIKTHQNKIHSIDLEAIALHRGSSFGAMKKPQPTQVNFENNLASTLLRLNQKSSRTPLLVEDESRLIGKCVQPENFFSQMKASPIVMIEEPLAVRVEQIYKEYIEENELDSTQMYQSFLNSFLQISKKLGATRFQELCADLLDAKNKFLKSGDHFQNRVWIEKTLRYYYDPLYLKSLEKKKDRVVFRGNKKDALEYLLSQT